MASINDLDAICAAVITKENIYVCMYIQLRSGYMYGYELKFTSYTSNVIVEFFL